MFCKYHTVYTYTLYVFSKDQGSVIYYISRLIDTNIIILQIVEKATRKKVRFLLTLPLTPPLHPPLANIGKASLLIITLGEERLRDSEERWPLSLCKLTRVRRELYCNDNKKGILLFSNLVLFPVYTDKKEKDNFLHISRNSEWSSCKVIYD